MPYWKMMIMDNGFDIYTLLFLVLAVVIFLRLRSVLGRRTGNERQPYDPYSPSNDGQKTATDNVVPMSGKQKPSMAAFEDAPQTPESMIKGFAPVGSELADGLVDIMRNDQSFEPKQFLSGAQQAYELIVTSFNEGNAKTLKPLLNKDVYEGFSSAIREREDRGEIVDSSFVGIDKADMIEAELKNKTAQITIKFVSQLITAIRNRNGEVIDGDPKAIHEVTDIWTFAREISSRDPNWKLVATQTAN